MLVRTFFFFRSSSCFLRWSSNSLLSFSSYPPTEEAQGFKVRARHLGMDMTGFTEDLTVGTHCQSGLSLLLSFCADSLLLGSLSATFLLLVHTHTHTHTRTRTHTHTHTHTHTLLLITLWDWVERLGDPFG